MHTEFQRAVQSGGIHSGARRIVVYKKIARVLCNSNPVASAWVVALMHE
jgi:hypothetical protein